MRTIACMPVLMCLLYAAPALAQVRPQDIVWRGPGMNMVIGIIALLVAFLAIMILIYLNTRRKNAEAEKAITTKLFNEGCERFRFTAEELKIIRTLAAYVPEASAKSYQIFEMPMLFEICIDTFVMNNYRSPQAADLEEILSHIRKKLGFNILPPDQPLMSTRNITTGQKVTINPTGIKSTGIDALVAHVGEFGFTLRVTESGARLDFPSKSEQKIFFLRHGDASYTIEAKVKETVPSSGQILFYHTLEFMRNQNRRYMRLDINLPLKFRVIGTTDPKVKPALELVVVRSMDIGGGGLSFIAETPREAGDILLLALAIPGRPLGGIKAKVLRVITVEGRTMTQYKHLLQFVSIEPQQREQIIRFVFEKHREMLQMR